MRPLCHDPVEVIEISLERSVAGFIPVDIETDRQLLRIKAGWRRQWRGCRRRHNGRQLRTPRRYYTRLGQLLLQKVLRFFRLAFASVQQNCRWLRFDAIRLRQILELAQVQAWQQRIGQHAGDKYRGDGRDGYAQSEISAAHTSPAAAARVVKHGGTWQRLFRHLHALSGNQEKLLSCGWYLMSITMRRLIVKQRPTRASLRGQRKPLATIHERLSGEL